MKDGSVSPSLTGHVRGPAPPPPTVSHLGLQPNGLFEDLNREIGSSVAGQSRRAAAARQASLLPGDADKIEKAFEERRELEDEERRDRSDDDDFEFEESCQTSDIIPPDLPPRPSAASLAELDEDKNEYEDDISDIGSIE